MKLRAGALGISMLAFVATGAHLSRADTLVSGAPSSTFTISTVVNVPKTPTSFAFLPDGRLLITEKSGELLLADAQGATTQIGYFTVDSSSEKGLLHVILHPGFASNRLLIFYYSLADSAGGTSLDRHRVVTVKLDATDNLDMTTETILVRGLRGPANHDGGALAIGPDGKLYIGVGDTGCNSGQQPVPPYPPTNYFATCLTNGNGKILRVNLDGSIPSDNPLVGKTVTSCGTTCGTDVTTLPLGAAREDIWAWGLRNPWRFWFDSKTGNLWVGDVGEVTYEEIDVIPQTGGGKHYGWPWREGGQGHPPSQCQVITPNAGDCVDPQYYCQHGTSTTPGIDGQCTSITGGLIVDSCQFPSTFRGKYFFGDNAANWIATLDTTPDRSGIVAGTRQMIVNVSGGPVHLDVGPDGSLYYAVINATGAGSIQRLAPITKVQCPAGTDSGAGGASGAGGTGTGATTTAAGGLGTAGADASVGGGRASSGDSSSCGCKVGQRTPMTNGFAILAALAALTGSRRIGGRRGTPRGRTR